jgi:methionyl-tRNA formyltransferase
MHMAPGMDTGPLIDCRRTAINADDTAGTLHDRLADLGADLTDEALPAYIDAELTATPQSEWGITYAPKLDKDEALIDWRESADVIERRIRAFNPWPVAHTRFRGEGLRLWAAEVDTSPSEGSQSPGTILAANRHGLVLATGDGCLRLTEVQPAGKQRQAAASFINGYGVRAGDELGR